MKIYKCQYCNFTSAVSKRAQTKKERRLAVISAKSKMGMHYDTIHKELLPPDMNGFRYFYYTLTGKEKGKCIECGQETEFNKVSMKYSRFCNNPICKEKYKEDRDNKMLGKYGKIYLTDDPEFQKKMQAGRKIAGIYKWSDNKTKIGYLSSYELHFLKYLDEVLKWPAGDIMPSPHVYYYEYNGNKHFYMPDFFIPSLNLEIEIKDDGSAKNINADSRAKDKIKDELMKSLSNVFNYIKIVNKNYSGFEELIKKED